MSPDRVSQGVQIGSWLISTALSFTLVTSDPSKPHPCKPCWLLSLTLTPQPAVASWQFRGDFLDLQRCPFKDHFAEEWSFPPLVVSDDSEQQEQKYFVLPCGPLLLSTASLALPLTGSAGPTLSLVTDPQYYHWWQLLDQFYSLPPPILPGT